MSNEHKRLQLLRRHIHHVEENCGILADALLERGEFDFAKQLLLNGHIHDASKFSGIEWDHLNGWEDPLFPEAIKHHVTTNPHHPEYWGDIHQMPRIYVAEMVCDWQARSSELKGKGLAQWIEEDALSRYKFYPADQIYNEIHEFVNLLLEPAFAA
jgi:hypothetical protein